MNNKYILYCLILTVAIFFIPANQVNAQNDRKSKQSSKAILDLSRSLEENDDDTVLASRYEKAAKEASDKGEFALAEDFWTKAKTIYEKKKDNEKAASIEREIAKLQERQQNVEKAIKTYESASRKSSSTYLQRANTNDAQRLLNMNDPKAQSEYIQRNIDIFKETGNQKEKVIANQQMAEVNLKLDNKDEAISNLEEALNETQQPEEKIKISKTISDIYVADKKYDEAIELNKQLVKEAEKTENPRVKLKQLQNLSSTYIERQDIESGIESLITAYNLAMNKGQTIEARNILTKIVELYLEEKKEEEALASYSDFTSRLESVMTADSTLMDAQMYNLISEKITQLEKEKELSNELMSKKNTLNYSLIAIILLVLIFLLFVIKALYSIKKKNKKIALQSLRREMNPHFIFNSLNSVNHFIAQNNELEANKYLTSYSKLMRNIMQNSNRDFIPLSVELEQLREYLELEHLRFRDKFDYKINISDSLDTDNTLVPNMLIQPQLENAIWHGLRYAEEKGLLSLSIEQKDNLVEITIEDNGIGMEKSKELKTLHQKKHQSRGLSNTQERIKLLNELYKTNISLQVEEKNSGESGVIVTISFPFNLKTES